MEIVINVVMADEFFRMCLDTVDDFVMDGWDITPETVALEAGRALELEWSTNANPPEFATEIAARAIHAKGA